MDIQILHLLEGARAARGITVIIDVFRAFTVEPYLFRAGAKRVIPVADSHLARSLKAAHPAFVLCGERNGVKLEGFDFGNSPSALEFADLTGKTVIHTTSAGTLGLTSARQAQQVLAASLVNAKATAQYIQEQDPAQVSLVCMGWNAREKALEDTLCALYIQSLLKGSPPPDWERELTLLRQTAGAKFFDPTQQEVFPQRDFHLCVQVDSIPFALRLAPIGPGFGEMEKIAVSL